MSMTKLSTKQRTQERIRIVQEYLLMDFPTCDIITQCQQKWGITDRQIYRYIKKGLESFQKMNEYAIDKKRAYYIHRRKKLLRELGEDYRKTPAGVSAMEKILQGIEKLEGLHVEKHDITTKGESLNEAFYQFLMQTSEKQADGSK